MGQSKTKENLRILLTAARERGHAAEHILLYGPPGLGKTTLAHLISKTLGTNMRTTSGPAIERVGEIDFLTNGSQIAYPLQIFYRVCVGVRADA